MSTPTYAEIRDAALAAILVIVADPNASVTVNGTIYTRQNLAALRELVDWCAKKIAQASGRRGAVVAFQEPA